MRTTLSVDDDVAVELQRLQRSSRRPWKQVVNDVLRAGLAAEAAGARRRSTAPTRTAGVRLGLPKPGDIANVHEVLSLVEGDKRA